ncbi:MAG: deoxyribodipyrimidine photo-lyase [Flammeovirgaceae bacterium]|jgi:deoxyribodipyrimidine photo-lyase
MSKKQKIAIFWHRRDLRLHDNAGLYYALKGDLPVLPLFIFDTEILDKLEDKQDRRVEYIRAEVGRLRTELSEQGSSILVKYDKPINVWNTILEKYEVGAVYTNRDYEPYAKERDSEVAKLLEKHGIKFNDYKDHCIFEREEVLNGKGEPYGVFTPYSRKWLDKLNIEKSNFYVRSYSNEKYFSHFLPSPKLPLPSLEDMGFEAVNKEFPNREVDNSTLESYAEKRDFPAKPGTTQISMHLRFGTVSIREMARKGLINSEIWLKELIWRDFYMMVLDFHPRVLEESYKPKYDNIQWRNNEAEFEKWCAGKTGYPMVDAGMRQLNQTGYMHNRVRMVVASFLTKHLLIDWRWGEAYFAKKLLDYELSSNNGGWQWASGSGCDAAPYFRVFNPESQLKKFDKELKYIRKWVPEFQDIGYIPMVDHKMARQRALDTYKKGLDGN